MKLKVFLMSLMTVVLASCGNPVENAESAIQDGDYVKAAKCISELSVGDVQSMTTKEKAKLYEIMAKIMLSGNREVLTVLSTDSYRKIAKELEEATKEELREVYNIDE